MGSIIISHIYSIRQEMKPNPTYFPYPGSSSMRVPNLVRPKLSEEKFSPSAFSSLPMYSSAVTPSVSQPNQASSQASHGGNNPSNNSTLKLFPTAKPIHKLPQIPTSSNQKQYQSESIQIYFSQIASTPTNSQTGQVKQSLQSFQKWKAKQNLYKAKILQLSTELIVKNSLLSNFQELVKTESNSETEIKRLTLELSSSQAETLSLKDKLQLSQHHQQALKQKTQQLKKLKQLVQQLQTKQLSDLYNTNLPKMNKDKEFYVFKLIECENTLRQRDLKIAQLEKIQKIIIKEMDEIRNKTQVEKTGDIKKYLEREEELIKSITKYKVEIHNKDLEAKKVQGVYEGQMEVLRRENGEIKGLFEKNVKEYELENIQLKQRIKEQQGVVESWNVEAERGKQRESEERIELLESKLVVVLKQMQVTNLEYEQYKASLMEEVEVLKVANKKLAGQIKALKDSKETKQRVYETLLHEYDNLKKSSIDIERSLTTANSSAIKRCTQQQTQLKSLRASLQEKEKLLTQSHSKLTSLSLTTTPPTTDIETASIRSQNNLLHQKLKVLENKVIEHDFNNKLIQNLETENKYIKETVRIQTAEISFLKKQHLEVIESMITLNQRKPSEDSVPRAETFEEIAQVLDEHQTIFKDTKAVNFMQLFEQLNTLFSCKYSFLKLGLPLIPLRSTLKNQDNLQQSSSYHQDMTVTIFYQQHFKGLLMLFDIQDQQGCQVHLNQKIKQLMNSNMRLEEEVRKQNEKMEVMDGDLKLNDSENEKKDKIIDELGKLVGKLEANVSVAVEKLIKYEVLLDEANREIVQSELAVFSSRLEVMGVKEGARIDQEGFMRQIYSLEAYLKEILKIMGESSKLNIQQQAKSTEQLTKINIVLYKLFLKQASQDNLHLTQHLTNTKNQPVDDLLSTKYSVLLDIKQYYKSLILSEINKSANKTPEKA